MLQQPALSLSVTDEECTSGEVGGLCLFFLKLPSLRGSRVVLGAVLTPEKGRSPASKVFILPKKQHREVGR